MKQLFVGRYLRGFNRFISITSKLMNKSEEVERREKILVFWERFWLEATKEACGIGRSTLFLWKKKRKMNDLSPKSKRPHHLRRPTTKIRTVDAISQFRRAFPFLGKDKLERVLKEAHIDVSASTIGRVIVRENLPSSPKTHVAKHKHRKRKDRLPSDYPVKAPGDLICMDTITIQEHNEKKYIITLVDYFSRVAISRVYASPSSRNAKDLLLRMRIVLGTDIKAVNTDNGGEFLAEFERACHEMNIKHFFTYPRTPKMNPLAERFNRTIQEEAAFPLFSEPIEVWNKYIAHYIMLYNFFRPHYSLAYDTPVDIFLHHSQSNMLWTHSCSCVFVRFFIIY